MCFSAPNIPTPSATQKGQSPDMEMRARAEGMGKSPLGGAKEQAGPETLLASGVSPPVPGTRGRPLQNKLGSDIPVSASRGLLTT